jgi:iron complex transport system permease protein
LAIRKPQRPMILLELRLPRALLALVSGRGWARRGGDAGLLRNPLADPGLFGIAPGAALGAVLSFWTGWAASAWALPLFALAGAAGAMALLALIAGRSGGSRCSRLRADDRQPGGRADEPCHQPVAHALCHERDRHLADGRGGDRSWRDVWIAAPLTLAGIALLRAAGRASMP